MDARSQLPLTKVLDFDKCVIVDEKPLLITKWTEKTEWNEYERLRRFKQAAVRCLVWGTVCDISSVLISSASDIWNADGGSGNTTFRRKTIWHSLYFRNLTKRKRDVSGLGHWVRSQPRKKPYSPNRSLFFQSCAYL